MSSLGIDVKSDETGMIAGGTKVDTEGGGANNVEVVEDVDVAGVLVGV